MRCRLYDEPFRTFSNRICLPHFASGRGFPTTKSPNGTSPLNNTAADCWCPVAYPQIESFVPFVYPPPAEEKGRAGIWILLLWRAVSDMLRSFLLNFRRGLLHLFVFRAFFHGSDRSRTPSNAEITSVPENLRPTTNFP